MKLISLKVVVPIILLSCFLFSATLRGIDTPKTIPQVSPAEFLPNGMSYQVKHGKNVICSTDFRNGETLFFCQKKDLQNYKGTNEYVLVKYPVRDKALAGSNMIEFRAKRQIAKSTYFEFHATDDTGMKFIHIQRFALSKKYHTIQIPFLDLKCTKEPNAKINPEKIREISIVFLLNATDTLSIRDLRGKKKTEATLHVIPASGNSIGLFEAGVECILSFSGRFPANTSTARCEIRDYIGKKIFSSELKSANTTLNLGQLPSGYYEIRVFPILSDGTLSQESCLISNGWENLPGLATFAVMPTTKEENIRDMRKYGANSFYGLMNTRQQFSVHELMGIPWCIEAPRWRWYEPQRAGNVIDGLSAWAVRAMKQAKRPDYLFSTLSLSHQDAHHLALWSKTKHNFIRYSRGEMESPEFLRFLRSAVVLYKYQYSHMKKRIYEITWEPDLECRYGNTSINDILNYYKKIVPIIKELDPDSLIYGPKATFHMPWIREIFKAGLGQYLDGISGHFYTTPLPEEGRLPEKIAEYRSIVKAATGREMRICNTEGGYYSKVLGINDLKEQARRDLRYALIMQGENIDFFLLFFLFDFSGERYTTWGLFFTDTPDGGFSPKRLMPKPIVPAYAVAAWLLRGAKPVINLRWFDSNVWGYVFQRDNQPVIALWNPYREQKIQFPVGDRKSVVKIDMMGQQTRLPVKNGSISLTISQDVTYLLETDPEIWMGKIADKTADNGVCPLELFCGKTTSLPADVHNVNVVAAAPLHIVKKDDNSLGIFVPQNAVSGIIPLQITRQGEKQILFTRVNLPLQVENGKFLVENGTIFLLFPVRNNSAAAVYAEIVLTASGLQYQKKLMFLPGEGEIRIPVFQNVKNPDPLVPFSGELQVKIAENTFTKPFSYTFLAAWPRLKNTSENLYQNNILLAGRGASGKTDTCHITFYREKDFLELQAEITDDVFHQRKSDATIWMQDSLQIAFDTDPHNVYEYDELTARLSKKVTSLGFAQTPAGPLAYRYKTFHEKILSTGDVTDAIPFSIRRQNGKTIYAIRIPWEQIGLSPEEAVPGKELGISVLINDSDGEKTARRTMTLFGGIQDESGWRHYGILNLR